MRSLFVAAILVALVSVVIQAEDAPKADEKKNAKPVVVIETSMGTIEAELYPDKAPITVENFLGYVKDKFYDGTIFHRVWDGFMIQGGGFTPDLVQKKTKDMIKGEADNGLKNEVGTLAMARLGQAMGKTPASDTASAEFFINVVDNAFLNHKNKTEAGYGYTVFGKVVSGMDVVNKIKAVKVANKMGTIDGQKAPLEKVPVEPVTIKSIRLKE